MNRQDVINNNLVDRYLLGQMDEQECDTFEAYYLDCPETLDELETTQKLVSGFAGNALAALTRKQEKAAAVATPSTGKTSRTWPFAAVAAGLVAALCLGVAVQSQNALQELRSTVASADLNTPIVSLGVTRGVQAAQWVELPTKPTRMVFALDIGVDLAAKFALSLVNADGLTIWQAEPLVADDFGALTFTLPPGMLAPGTFEFVARPVAEGGSDIRIPILVEASAT